METPAGTAHTAAAEVWEGTVTGAAIKQRTILLVEDEKFVREVTAEILRSSGYRVLVASNGDDANIAYAHGANEIDLLLTDVILPRFNGRVLAARWKQANPQLKVLFVTGYAEQMKVNPTTLGRCLAKPFCSEALLRAVAELFAEAKESREPARPAFGNALLA